VTLALWAGALASLHVINRNPWSLAGSPLIFGAGHVKLSVPRGRLGFYVCGPARLAVLGDLARLLLQVPRRLFHGGAITAKA
jgi:hypothetical protein